GRLRSGAGERQTGPGNPRDSGSRRGQGPAAQGRSQCAAAGADLRFVVRPLPRRDHSDPCAGRRGENRTADPAVVQRHGARSGGAGLPIAQGRSGRLAFGRRGRFPVRQYQNRQRSQDRRHDHERRRHVLPTAARLRGDEADGLRRALSGGEPRARPAARRTGEAAVERFGVQFRARELRGAGLRLPLRLPGAAAPGDCAGAAGARVCHRPDHHGAKRALPRELANGEVLEVDNPTKWPNPSEIKQVEEPMIEATVITREDSLGEILKLLEEKRGDQKKFEHLGGARVMLVYEMPLNEIVLDFYDRLKSASRGYASLDYHLCGYRASSLVKMDVLVAGDPIDALSIIVHKEFAYERGRALIERLRRLIPRQQFEVALQAAIGSKIIARESIAALRKNVLAKCYGGDITRKRKLLEKQK